MMFKSLFNAALLSVGISAAVLEVFQVEPPVLTPSGLTNGTGNPYAVNGATGQGCVVQQVLVQHVFGYSYGTPYVGSYTPPSCNFNRVTWNLTVTSAGRQFDRLGAIYFGDTELWRTSTAEPTQAGIHWTYIKDMSHYLALMKQPQKLIFDLGNLIDSTYTGSYNVTLTATYFTGVDTVNPADQILAISTHQAAQNQSSQFSFPGQNATNSVTLPRNIKKAVVSIAATGQIGEEFWYTNVPNSVANTFGAGFLYGGSPYREVQLYIDGLLAGIVEPFPIIFTGGIVPGLWRPIVGIDAFDLREDEIDVTPFLPLLCDGKNHTFSIAVSGLNEDGHGGGSLAGTVPSYWLITGKIFLWLDRPGSITTGSSITRNVPQPAIAITSSFAADTAGVNETLAYSVSVQRQLSISSYVRTASGSFSASWQQAYTYSNTGNLTDYGNFEVNIQSTVGVDTASTGYTRSLNYPVWLNSTYVSDPVSGNYSITADIHRGQQYQIAGSPVFPTGLQSFEPIPAVRASYPAFQGSNLATTQNGSAVYQADPAAGVATSFGTTSQEMTLAGIEVDSTAPGFRFPGIKGSQELYHRYVSASNSTVVTDEETLIGKVFGGFSYPPHFRAPPTHNRVALGNQKKVLGRGRGNAN